MKFTKTLLAVALAGASSAALASHVAPHWVPVANWTGELVFYDPAGNVMDANDDAAGTSAYVTGVIDAWAGTFTLASTDTFYGVNWTASGGTLFGPGTYTHSTIESNCGGAVACGGDYTFTIAAGQLGGVVDIAWGATTGMDQVMVWDVVTVGGVTTYTSTDWDGDGTPGAGMIDGPFPGFTASFNMVAVPEASTYAMMLAGLGLVGFAARRRKHAKV